MRINPRWNLAKVLTFVALLGVFTLANRGVAQEERQSDAKQAAGSDESAQEKDSPVTAIVGGEVYTVSGEIIRNGTVLIQDGKILDVGQSVAVPEGAEVVDATGKVVTPGFIAISMDGIGVSGTPNERNKLADMLDPFDRDIKFALGVGITTGCVELSGGRGRFGRFDGEIMDPSETGYAGDVAEDESGDQGGTGAALSKEELDYGDANTSTCPCCGLPVLPTEPITATPPSDEEKRDHAVVKMSYGHLDTMLVKDDVFYSPTLSSLSGGVNRHNWRIAIERAKEAVKRAESADEQEDEVEADEGDDSRRGRAGGRRSRRGQSGARSRGRRNNVDEDLLRLVRKEIPLRVRANTIDEIRDMVGLADELDYRLIIEGGIEAWLVASELSEADVSVIYTPRRRRDPQPGREGESGSSIESTGLFEKSGIPFATMTLRNSVSMGGLAGRDLTSLPLEAAFAVRGGAAERTALASLTLTPAKMLGLEDRIGSIEKGKDADLLILNGEPLDYRTYVETAIVQGRICYERDEDRIYPVFDRD